MTHAVARSRRRQDPPPALRRRPERRGGRRASWLLAERRAQVRPTLPAAAAGPPTLAGTGRPATAAQAATRSREAQLLRWVAGRRPGRPVVGYPSRAGLPRALAAAIAIAHADRPSTVAAAITVRSSRARRSQHRRCGSTSPSYVEAAAARCRNAAPGRQPPRTGGAPSDGARKAHDLTAVRFLSPREVVAAGGGRDGRSVRLTCAGLGGRVPVSRNRGQRSWASPVPSGRLFGGRGACFGSGGSRWPDAVV